MSLSSNFRTRRRGGGRAGARNSEAAAGASRLQGILPRNPCKGQARVHGTQGTPPLEASRVPRIQRRREVPLPRTRDQPAHGDKEARSRRHVPGGPGPRQGDMSRQVQVPAAPRDLADEAGPAPPDNTLTRARVAVFGRRGHDTRIAVRGADCEDALAPRLRRRDRRQRRRDERRMPLGGGPGGPGARGGRGIRFAVEFFFFKNIFLRRNIFF